MGMGRLVDCVLCSSARMYLASRSKMLLISLYESGYFRCFIPQTCQEFAEIGFGLPIGYRIAASFMTQYSA